MQSNVIVSIILPSYNRASYIGKTIESCIAQTYTDFELIIVDDCSSDNSVEVIQSYATDDSRITLIRNKVNKKLPATLNVGFAVAQGRYYTWISDDNLFEPNALESMVAVLETNKEVGLVYADYTTINSTDKIIARIYQESPEFLPIRDCVGACFMYRANLAKQIGPYNEDLFLIEDYEYWLRIGLHTRLYHIQKSLYLYRIHSSSLTYSRAEEIRLAKNLLKKQFATQYIIPQSLQPINELYNWFISEKKGYISYIYLLYIICKNPIVTMSYIMRHIVRMRR